MIGLIAVFRVDAHVRDIGAFLNDEHHHVPLTGELSLAGGLIAPILVTTMIRGGSMALLVATGRHTGS